MREKIEKLIRECGEIILHADRSSLGVDAKAGHGNFVTEYDKKIEAKLREGLLTIIPDAYFIGEEGEQAVFSDKGKFFIVDPIDGTANFIKDYHASSISAGLIVDGKAEMGFVYNPYLNEMFYAKHGEGAYCNGKPIHISGEPLEKGIVIVGTSPYHDELREKTIELYAYYYRRALDIRRSGSAAIELCSVAAGRAELYFETLVSPWDYAAGALILEEAGGKVTDLEGKALRYDRPCSLLASGTGDVSVSRG